MAVEKWKLTRLRGGSAGWETGRVPHLVCENGFEFSSEMFREHQLKNTSKILYDIHIKAAPELLTKPGSDNTLIVDN